MNSRWKSTLATFGAAGLTVAIAPLAVAEPVADAVPADQSVATAPAVTQEPVPAAPTQSVPSATTERPAPTTATSVVGRSESRSESSSTTEATSRAERSAATVEERSTSGRPVESADEGTWTISELDELLAEDPVNQRPPWTEAPQWMDDYYAQNPGDWYYRDNEDWYLSEGEPVAGIENPMTGRLYPDPEGRMWVPGPPDEMDAENLEWIAEEGWVYDEDREAWYLVVPSLPPLVGSDWYWDSSRGEWVRGDVPDGRNSDHHPISDMDWWDYQPGWYQHEDGLWYPYPPYPGYHYPAGSEYVDVCEDDWEAPVYGGGSSLLLSGQGKFPDFGTAGKNSYQNPYTSIPFDPCAEEPADETPAPTPDQQESDAPGASEVPETPADSVEPTPESPNTEAPVEQVVELQRAVDVQQSSPRGERGITARTGEIAPIGIAVGLLAAAGGGIAFLRRRNS